MKEAPTRDNFRMIEDELKEVVNSLKACISSRKGGVPFCELDNDYKELLGEGIPFKKFGHRDLAQFLGSIPGVYVDDREGTVRTTPTANTLHLHELISQQKGKVTKKYKKYQPYKKNKAPPQARYDRNCSQPPGRSYNNQSHKSTYGYQKLSHKSSYYQKDLNCDTYAPKLPPRWENSDRKRPEHSKISEQKQSNCENSRQEVWFNRTVRKPGRQFFDGRHISYDNNTLSINSNEEYEWSENSEGSLSRSDSCILSYQVFGDALLMLVLGCHPSTYCTDDMTVEHATMQIMDFGCPDKVLIALGTVDILKGRTAIELVFNMEKLIKTILKTGAKVMICTLPPIPSIRAKPQLISYVVAFNNWVRRAKHGADVIDLNNLFKDEKFSVNYKLFERSSVRIPHCKLLMSLWNERGLNMVAKELVYHCSMNF